MKIVESRHALVVALWLGMAGAAAAEVEPAQLTECMVGASGEAEEKVFEDLLLALDQKDEVKAADNAEAMAASVQSLARRACSPLLKDLPTEVYRIGIRRYMDAMGAQTRARMNAKE